MREPDSRDGFGGSEVRFDRRAPTAMKSGRRRVSERGRGIIPLPRPGPALWFGLRFACLLGIFMYPWPLVGELYSDAAGTLGNLLLGDVSAMLHFARPEAQPELAGDRFSTELRAQSPDARAPVRVPIDLRTLTFIPTVVFLALTLAAPLWKSFRGVTVLVLGLLALHAFLIASITIPLVLFFSDPQPMHLFDIGSTLRQMLDVVYRSLVAPPGMAYAVPTLLWLALLWLVPEDLGDVVAR